MGVNKENDMVQIPVDRYNRWKEIVKSSRNKNTIFIISHMTKEGIEIKEVDYKGKDPFMMGLKKEWNNWYTEACKKIKDTQEIDSLRTELSGSKSVIEILKSENQKLRAVIGENDNSNQILRNHFKNLIQKLSPIQLLINKSKILKQIDND